MNQLEDTVKNLHSPLWSLTTKGSVNASRILKPWGFVPGTTLAPILNFRLRIQLELSVNSISPTTAELPLNVTVKSPWSNGLLPVLSLTILLSNCSLVQESSFGGKSPSRTIISTLIGWGSEIGSIWPPLLSTTWIWREFPSTSSILLPVKIGSERFLENTSCKLDGWRAWIRSDDDRLNEREHRFRTCSTSSFT